LFGSLGQGFSALSVILPGDCILVLYHFFSDMHLEAFPPLLIVKFVWGELFVCIDRNCAYACMQTRRDTHMHRSDNTTQNPRGHVHIYNISLAWIQRFCLADV